MEVIVRTLSKERDHAREICESIIDSEQNYLFTNDIDYKENRSQIVQQNMGGGPGGPNGPGGPGGPGGEGGGGMPPPQRGGSNHFVNELRTRIDAYFKLVLRSVRDSIPKTIGYFLVRKSQDALQFELYNAINSNMALQNSLGEPANITARRKSLKSVLDTLKNSLKVLQRDPE